MRDQLWWYVARAGGLVSWAVLAASMLWGLALSTRAFGRRPRPNWLLDLHRFLGGAAAIFTAIHVAAIVVDSFVHFGLTDVLVPLASRWHPVAVAWGIVAMYLLAAVEITSLVRNRLPRRIWRRVHYLSFPLFVLATIHGLSAGTDARNRMVLIGGVLVCAVLAGLVAVRVDTGGQAEPDPAPRRTVTSQPVHRLGGHTAQEPERSSRG